MGTQRERKWKKKEGVLGTGQALGSDASCWAEPSRIV